MANETIVVYVVLDDEGKVAGVYFSRESAEVMRDAVDGEIFTREVLP